MTKTLSVALACILIVVVTHPLLAQCTDLDGDGHFVEVGCETVQDCNDDAPLIHPGAIEFCDGYDDNCDGQIDESPLCDRTCDVPMELLKDPTIVNITNVSPDVTSLAWTGSINGMAWDGGGSIYFATVDGMGHIASGETLVVSSSARHPSLVWSGTHFGIAWEDSRDGNSEIYFARMDAEGSKVGSEVRITSTSGESSEPSLVWTGTQFAVVWSEADAGQLHLFFARVDALGALLDPPIQLTFGVAQHRSSSLAWTSSGFGLAWGQGPFPSGVGWVYFATLDPTGGNMSPVVQVGSNRSAFPSLVWAGTHFGLAWADNVGGVINGPEEYDIYFATLDSDGEYAGVYLKVAGTHDPLNVFSTPAVRPSVTWTGEEFGITWEEMRYPLYPLFAVRAYFVTLDESAILSREVIVSPGSGRVPVVAWTGDGYSIAWRDSQVILTRVGCGCVDADADGHSRCQECDDTSSTVYPDAPELCDGVNNDCSDPAWPTAPSNEIDADGDGFRVCTGDCNDSSPTVYPGATEVCNGIDDNCNSQTDENAQGVDSDGDGVHNACDNCPAVGNPGQVDTDGDGRGTSCDNCPFVANPSQADPDLDGRGDVCDNCSVDYNPFQDDWDVDRVGDACDNCVFDYNTEQANMDADFEGDYCDLDDGLILIRFYQPEYVEWQEEVGFETWNSYRGDLAVLRASGVYTQAPGSNDLARQNCGLAHAWSDEFDSPEPGAVAFFLTTGVVGGIEGGLGANSAEVERPNTNPCP